MILAAGITSIKLTFPQFKAIDVLKKNAVMDVTLLDHHMSTCTVEVASKAFVGVCNFY